MPRPEGARLVQLDFVPSRTLTVYLARLFATRTLAVLVMLVLVLQTLDLLGTSGDILAHKGNGDAQLWMYVGLRIPQLIARFLPYSVLLATIITLAGLNQNSEVISMKAAGLSAHQVLAPLVLAAGVVALLSFAFNERVVTRATATLDAWQAVDYGPIPKTTSVRQNVYLRTGNDILMAQTVTGEGPAMAMQGVTYYRRDAAGGIVEELRGARATFRRTQGGAPAWLLDAPTRFVAATTALTRMPSALVAVGLTPAAVAISKIDADGQDVIALSRSIAQLKAASLRTSALNAAWWHRFSGPLAAMLMPLLAAVAAFGLARSGALLIRAVIGMALGFAFFVFDNAALAMGNFGAYPPLLAAWGPFVLFALIGEAVLIRTEE